MTIRLMLENELGSNLHNGSAMDFADWDRFNRQDGIRLERKDINALIRAFAT
jgi:hypothetical protein